MLRAAAPYADRHTSLLRAAAGPLLSDSAVRTRRRCGAGTSVRARSKKADRRATLLLLHLVHAAGDFEDGIEGNALRGGIDHEQRFHMEVERHAFAADFVVRGYTHILQ